MNNQGISPLAGIQALIANDHTLHPSEKEKLMKMHQQIDSYYQKRTQQMPRAPMSFPQPQNTSPMPPPMQQINQQQDQQRQMVNPMQRPMRQIDMAQPMPPQVNPNYGQVLGASTPPPPTNSYQQSNTIGGYYNQLDQVNNQLDHITRQPGQQQVPQQPQQIPTPQHYHQNFFQNALGAAGNFFGGLFKH